eukprot:5355882-Pyramimonas_sp.AAC.1
MFSLVALIELIAILLRLLPLALPSSSPHHPPSLVPGFSGSVFVSECRRYGRAILGRAIVLT